MRPLAEIKQALAQGRTVVLGRKIARKIEDLPQELQQQIADADLKAAQERAKPKVDSGDTSKESEPKNRRGK